MHQGTAEWGHSTAMIPRSTTTAMAMAPTSREPWPAAPMVWLRMPQSTQVCLLMVFAHSFCTKGVLHAQGRCCVYKGSAACTEAVLHAQGWCCMHKRRCCMHRGGAACIDEVLHASRKCCMCQGSAACKGCMRRAVLPAQGQCCMHGNRHWSWTMAARNFPVSLMSL